MTAATAPDKLDEAALRRPGLDLASAVPIALADGQTWHLARPATLCMLGDDEDSLDYVHHFYGQTVAFNDDYNRRCEALDSAFGSGDTASIMRAEMGLFAALIRASYDLDTAQLRQVLKLDYSAVPDPALAELRSKLSTLVVGGDPNAEPPAEG